jgi:predicted Zn finger-like uncharacterized protein
MLIKCKNCQTKLKISDEKVTEEGIKIKCPKCSSVLLVKKPAEKKEEALKEEQLEAAVKEETPEPPTEEEPPAEEGFSLPEEPPTEEEPPAEEGFSLPEEPSEEPSEEDVLEGFDDDSFSTEDAQDQEAQPEAPSEEASTEPEPSEEFQLDTNFDFGGGPEEAGEELASSLDLAGDVVPGEAPEEESPFGQDDMSLSLRDEPEEKKDADTLSLSDDMPPAPSDMPSEPSEPKPKLDSRQPRKKAAAKEITGYGVSTRRSIPIIIPIILVVAIMGATYFVYEKIKVEPKVDKGELIISEENGGFADNEKEGKIFIITGKVKNGYKTDRSFIQVKGMLFNDNNDEIVSKVVYAGNIPTELECKKLSIEELDKLLNRKMGEELSNMNVAADTLISFKIIFANVDEKLVTQFKVIGAGSQPAYNP